MESFVSGLMRATKKWSGKERKIDEAPGMRAASRSGRFISAFAFAFRYYRCQFFKPRRTATAVRHFRLTGRYRVSDEKSPHRPRVDARPCLNTANRDARIFGDGRSAVRKTCRRVAVDSIFEKLHPPARYPRDSRHCASWKMRAGSTTASYFRNASRSSARKSVCA